MRVEKSFRGISERLTYRYLGNLGGERTDDGVEGEGWTAEVSSEKVAVGPSLELTEVTVVFEGEEAAVEDLIEDFSRKAMRAGG